MNVKKTKEETHPFRICKSLTKSENKRMDMTNTLSALEKLELKVGHFRFLILLFLSFAHFHFLISFKMRLVYFLAPQVLQ